MLQPPCFRDCVAASRMRTTRRPTLPSASDGATYGTLPPEWKGVPVPVSADVTLGRDVVIFHPELVNLYGCTIGDECKIATFVEIQRGVVLGRRVKVEAFAFLPTGVTHEDGVFVGPHVTFTNDR